MMRRNLLYLIICLLLCLFVFSQWRWTEVTVDRGWAMEAHQKPFLAAELFLQGLGKQVQSDRGSRFQKQLDHMSPLSRINSAVVISADRYPLKAQEVTALLHWVERGGVLILAAQRRSYDAGYDEDRRGREGRIVKNNPLFEAFEIDLHGEEHPIRDDRERRVETPDVGLNDVANTLEGERKRDPVSDCSAEKRANEQYRCDAEIEDTLTQIRLSDHGEWVMGYFNHQRHMVDRSSAGSEAFANRHGNQLIRFHYGDGVVTLLTDDALWRNERIALFDHAYLLAQLVADVEEVWLIYGMGRGVHWIIRFWYAAWPFMTAFTLLLLLFIWKAGQRLGPVRAETVVTGRDVLEHIDAGNRFYWARFAGRPLLTSLRMEVYRLIEKRLKTPFSSIRQSGQIPSSSKYLSERKGALDAETLTSVVAAVSTEADPITEAELMEALQGPLQGRVVTRQKPSISEAEFLKYVKILKQVRERL